ncbi:replicative DNA helicase [Marilutibacter spongiae]|uniref:Replicative DNA helicase n=1 Tax=Marilutibacter spongiae TaxID=2025720 RepID=A0A7W3TLQ9_9GAMM|nr:replicative DNA helicase [Lysobacter spongiae]MBB1060399.1 replicative DNA helicase [Lysobacter spongiae]
MNAMIRDERQENRHADLVQLRLPPQAIEAEQAVLGALMIKPKAWDEVSDLLTADSFYRRDHRLIWEAIETLHKARKPFDAITLGAWFEDMGLGEQVAGGAYLIELDSTTPSAANVRAYAEIVAEKAMLRRMIDVGTDLVNDAYSPEGRPSVELIGQAQTRIGSLMENEPCDLEPVQSVMQRVFDNLQDRHQRDTEIHGLRTGIDDLDRLLAGIRPGQLVILAARPKMGKTTLAQNIAEHCAIEQKQPVAVFTFEMSPEELGDRMLSSQGGVDGNRVRSGQLDDVDWANADRAVKRLRGASLLISRPRSARVEHIVAQVRRQHARQPLGLVVIDYLQLIEVRGDNRSAAFGDVTRALKLMAVELGVPVILLSQLNRGLESRNDKRPVPADLRDSGAIEQDADVVIFIYRDEAYDKATRYRGTAEIIVALQRNGPSGDVRAKYQPELFRFSNLPIDWEPAPLPESDGEGGTRRRGFRKVKGGNAAADRAAGDE